MRINFTSFNYKPGADLAAEERAYLGEHVALARALPGLHIYLTGVYRANKGSVPAHHRAAFFGFDSAAASMAALESQAGARMRAHGAAHLADLRPMAMDGEEIVRFDGRRSGQRCFLFAAEFDLNRRPGEELAAAEHRYLDYHTGVARRLPGLRYYMVGRLVDRSAPGGKADRLRAALLVFDSVEAWRAAYRSPVGEELVKDEEASIANARVHRLDAVVQL
ncbi:MAG TPA: EthD family reductase [Candidatus Binataceae bacterium]|jgi:uncharacterized protein (TIGR02118 family)|nr:EthD family reductase [Candidatus Binataceae bacterium]